MWRNKKRRYWRLADANWPRKIAVGESASGCIAPAPGEALARAMREGGKEHDAGRGQAADDREQ